MALGVAIALVLAVGVASVREDPEVGTASWDAARAAGFAGYLLLWASVMTGMAVNLRLRPGGAPLTVSVETHRMLSALGLSFVAGHAVALILDPVVHFSPWDAVVPFTSAYRPWQTGAGTIALWLVVVVLASTAFPALVSHSRWRAIHYLSFPCWALALVHGFTAGTDTNAALALTLYAVTSASVAALVTVRVFGRAWLDEPATRTTVSR